MVGIYYTGLGDIKMSQVLKTIGKCEARRIRERINHELDHIGKDIGCNIEAQKGTYTNNYVKFDLICAIIDPKTGLSENPEVLAFKEKAHMWGLIPDDIGRHFFCQDEEFVICGAKKRAHKYPILARSLKNNKVYKFSLRIISEALNNGNIQESSEASTVYTADSLLTFEQALKAIRFRFETLPGIHLPKGVHLMERCELPVITIHQNYLNRINGENGEKQLTQCLTKIINRSKGGYFRTLPYIAISLERKALPENLQKYFTEKGLPVLEIISEDRIQELVDNLWEYYFD